MPRTCIHSAKVLYGTQYGNRAYDLLPAESREHVCLRPPFATRRHLGYHVGQAEQHLDAMMPEPKEEAWSIG